MANLNKIRELCSVNNITLRELAKRVGISEVGLQRIINTNSTKVETIERIAQVLNVSVSTFFTEDSFLFVNYLHEFITSPYSKMLLNTYDKISDKIEFLKNYYVLEAQLQMSKNNIPAFIFEYDGAPKTIFDNMPDKSLLRTVFTNIQTTPFSKMHEFIKKQITELPYFFKYFYFYIFKNNILNIKDYLNEGLLDDPEIIKHWNLYKEYKIE